MNRTYAISALAATTLLFAGCVTEDYYPPYESRSYYYTEPATQVEYIRYTPAYIETTVIDPIAPPPPRHATHLYHRPPPDRHHDKHHHKADHKLDVHHAGHTTPPPRPAAPRPTPASVARPAPASVARPSPATSPKHRTPVHARPASAAVAKPAPASVARPAPTSSSKRRTPVHSKTRK